MLIATRKTVFVPKLLVSGMVSAVNVSIFTGGVKKRFFVCGIRKVNRATLPSARAVFLLSKHHPQKG
jgi:hypothetical protein